jgi:hypothetical protein
MIERSEIDIWAATKSFYVLVVKQFPNRAQ